LTGEVRFNVFKGQLTAWTYYRGAGEALTDRGAAIRKKWRIEMGINGIGTVGYPLTGYTARKTGRSAESGAVGFMGTVEEKAAQGKEVDQDEKAFEMVGPNAPQEVKDAWMDAAKEVNANGMGIRGNGMVSHISQMMLQRLNKQLKGETENFDILGNTVESAIQATKKVLYDLEHPVVCTPRSIEAQQARIKEGEFYRAFLEKLEKLYEGISITR
jgi:hypothetical protein